jgi:hypothetical protein
MGRQPPVQLS